MYELDAKDKKILFALDHNCRQSLQQIGKKALLPKNVVAYRIKQLEEKGIINNYYAEIDASRLGYFSIRFYIKFQFTSPEIEDEIIDYFKKTTNSWWVARTEPLFDLAVIIWVKELPAFYQYWQKTLVKYGYYFQQQIYSLYVEALHYKSDYLIYSKHKQRTPIIIGSNTPTVIDKLEEEILQYISINARISIVELAQKVKSTVRIVMYRLKQLEEKKIILGYRTTIDLQKIGYSAYRINWHLNDFSKKKQMQSYLEQFPNLIYINNAISNVDLETEFHFKSIEELQKLIDEVKNKFKDTLKNVDYFLFKKIEKEAFMPLS